MNAVHVHNNLKIAVFPFAISLYWLIIRFGEVSNIFWRLQLGPQTRMEAIMCLSNMWFTIFYTFISKYPKYMDVFQFFYHVVFELELLPNAGVS